MINNLVESVKNAADRFRTIAGIYPETENGEIKIYSGADHCDFDMILDGRPVRLRCHIRSSTADRERLSAVSSFLAAIDEPCYNRFEYLEGELLVFDDGESYFYVDVSIEDRPYGKPLADYVQQCFARGSGLPELISGLVGFAERHSSYNLRHGNLAADRIFVAPSGSGMVTGFEHASRNHPGCDMANLACMVGVVMLAASDPRAVAMIPATDPDGKPVAGELLSSYLYLTGGRDNADGPAGLIRSALSMERIDFLAGMMGGVLENVRLKGFLPDPQLSSLLDNGGIGIYPGGRRTVNHPRVRYRFVGELSCMMMRAYDGSSWCYLDKNSRVAIPGPFVDAFDFCEGIALVETDTGYGVIDREGKYVIEPVYEDIGIDDADNRLIVTREGLSSLLSWSGQPVTAVQYEHIVPSQDGFFIVKKGNRYGFIDRDGRAVTDIVYDDVDGFAGGRAQVVLKGRKYVIGTSGEIIDEVIAAV